MGAFDKEEEEAQAWLNCPLDFVSQRVYRQRTCGGSLPRRLINATLIRMGFAGNTGGIVL